MVEGAAMMGQSVMFEYTMYTMPTEVVLEAAGGVRQQS